MRGHAVAVVLRDALRAPQDDGDRSSMPPERLSDSILKQPRGTTSPSRGAMRPKFCISFTPNKNQRAQGRPGARCTRGLMCDVHKKMLHMSIQVQRRTPGLPCAMALRLIRDRPGDPAFCDTIALGQRWLPSNLTPASGRRTQTISPYATDALVFRTIASTAPCPAFATTADAPLVGQDGGSCAVDLPDVPTGIFLREGLDPHLGVICPTGSLNLVCPSHTASASHTSCRASASARRAGGRVRRPCR